MTHLWSHYLSNCCSSHLSYMVQQVTDVCSLLGKDLVLVMDVLETPSTKIVSQQAWKWPVSCAYCPEMMHFLY